MTMDKIREKLDLIIEKQEEERKKILNDLVNAPEEASKPIVSGSIVLMFLLCVVLLGGIG